MFGHCLALGTAGVVTVGHQAGGDPGCVCAHLSPVAVEEVEQSPGLIVFGLWSDEYPTVTERVKIPHPTVVIGTQAIQPVEDVGL